MLVGGRTVVGFMCQPDAGDVAPRLPWHCNQSHKGGRKPLPLLDTGASRQRFDVHVQPIRPGCDPGWTVAAQGATAMTGKPSSCRGICRVSLQRLYRGALAVRSVWPGNAGPGMHCGRRRRRPHKLPCGAQPERVLYRERKATSITTLHRVMRPQTQRWQRTYADAYPKAGCFPLSPTSCVTACGMAL
jgi:hypothetical protein